MMDREKPRKEKKGIIAAILGVFGGVLAAHLLFLFDAIMTFDDGEEPLRGVFSNLFHTVNWLAKTVYSFLVGQEQCLASKKTFFPILSLCMCYLIFALLGGLVGAAISARCVAGKKNKSDNQ